jgi:hypothetical protein
VSKSPSEYLASQDRLLKLAASQRESTRALPANIPVPQPGDPDWGTTRRCSTENQFVQVADGIDPDAVLLSRHVHCQRMQSTEQKIDVDIMRVSSTAPWEFYRPGVSYFELKSATVGTAVLATFFQAYGPASSLSTKHEISSRVISFTADSEFPTNLALAALAITLTPKVYCERTDVYAGTASDASCDLPAGSTLTLDLNLVPGSNRKFVSSS